MIQEILSGEIMKHLIFRTIPVKGSQRYYELKRTSSVFSF